MATIKDKQRSTKHTHKTKDRVTRNPLKTGGELGCSGRVAVLAPLFKCKTQDVWGYVTQSVKSYVPIMLVVFFSHCH